MEQKLSAGIDVSKETLDVHYNDADGKQHHLKIKNTNEGFQKMFSLLGNRTYVMESSGVLYLKLAYFLEEKGCPVMVENALVIKRFIQTNKEKNKTDKKDAKWIWTVAN